MRNGVIGRSDLADLSFNGLIIPVSMHSPASLHCSVALAVSHTCSTFQLFASTASFHTSDYIAVKMKKSQW